jgi:alpha-galactosidase
LPRHPGHAGLSPAQDARWEREDYTQWRLYHEIGHFIGCGNWHTFDYVPYCNHRMFRHAHYNTWERACLAVLSRRQAGRGGELGSHLATEEALRTYLDGHEREQMFAIMRALSGDAPPYHYLSGNMPNAGHLGDVPEGTIVELPATVSTAGIALHAFEGALPRVFASWLQQHVGVHELSVRAVLDKSRQAAIEAIAADPVFRDCDCSPGQLLDEMLRANEGLVPALR